MRRLLFVLLLLAAFASVPCARAADLYPVSPRLDLAESILAQKSVNVVCYQSEAAWESKTYSVGLTGPGVVDGFTFPGAIDTFLAPRICATAYYAMRVGAGKVNIQRLGRAVNVLSHEAFHLRGISSEATAEACGDKYLATFAHDAFNVGYHTALMRRVVAAGLAFTLTKPAQYAGGVCPV